MAGPGQRTYSNIDARSLSTLFADLAVRALVLSADVLTLSFRLEDPAGPRPSSRLPHLADCLVRCGFGLFLRGVAISQFPRDCDLQTPEKSFRSANAPAFRDFQGCC